MWRSGMPFAWAALSASMRSSTWCCAEVEKRPPKLDLDVYPYLPKANVGKTCAASYLCLMSGGVR